MPPSSGPNSYCLDCRWLEIRLRMEGDSYYWCRSRQLPVRGSILRRRACGNFVPAPNRSTAAGSG